MTAGAVAADPQRRVAGLVEVFLFGPRWVVQGIGQLRLARGLRGRDLRRAGEIVGVLRAREAGVETRLLLRRGETLNELLPTLSWLAFHQWIGLGEGAVKVYLYSQARAALG